MTVTLAELYLKQGLAGRALELHDGYAEAFPGVRIIPTPGHTPAHQSLLVETRDGRVLIAVQATNDASEYGRAHLGWQVRQAAESLQMGKASEVSIRTEKLVAVARPLTPDYFVLLALAPDGNVGRARYELRVAGPKLAAQL